MLPGVECNGVCNDNLPSVSLQGVISSELLSVKCYDDGPKNRTTLHIHHMSPFKVTPIGSPCLSHETNPITSFWHQTLRTILYMTMLFIL